MKKIFALLAAAVVALSASAVDTQASDLRIYINPGHGSWTGGDRALGTVVHGAYNASDPDTCGFFESNTNLRKGFGLLDKLRDYGFQFDPTLNQENPNPARLGAALDLSNNLVMSHVKCGPYPLVSSDDPLANAYNRSLYEIASEADLNNFDMFISVHSNAATEGTSTNFPAFFYRGENSTASVPNSDLVAAKCWPYIYGVEHQTWSHYSMTNPDIVADIDFWSGDYAVSTIGGNTYKGYYGVLRQGVMGFLVEGYFHTYQPARHRAMNFDVDRNEGECYARGIADWFGIEKESTGDIYGIVRDLHERFKHQFYNASSTSVDAMLPINGATVKLLKDGEVIRTYTTDGEYNGAFVFDRLEPGDYYISVSAEGYRDAAENYCGPFKVEAAKTVYPRVYLENENYEPAAVTYYDYPDPVKTEAIKAASAYNVTATVADVAKEELAGKTVKRLIAHGDYVYVLAHDATSVPSIYVYNARTLELVSTVSIEGTEGTESAVGDIQITSDGVLVACAEEICQWDDSYVWTDEGEVRGDVNFYYWTNDADGVPSGDPVKWFSTQNSGHWYHAVSGTTMAYSGTLDEGQICMSAYSTYDPRKLRNVVIDISEREYAGYVLAQPDIAVMNLDNLGDNLTYTLSPLDPDVIVVNASKTIPMKLGKSNPGVITKMGGEAPAKEAVGTGFFRFAGHAMMVVPAADGVKLYDVTDGIELPHVVALNGADVESEDGLMYAAGRVTVVTDTEDEITEANIDLYLVRGGKMSRFTTTNTDQPVVKGVFAYGLKQTEANGEAVLTFSLTGDAKAHVELVPVETGNVIKLAEADYEAGENQVKVDLSALTSKYNWQVVVENDAVPVVNLIYKSTMGNGRGAHMDRNPESDFFGYAYASDPYSTSKGITMFTPALERVNETAYGHETFKRGNTASPYRIGILPSGKVMAADWSDATSGIWVLDPATPESGVTNLFAGSNNASTGEIKVDGTVIAGSSTGMCVYDHPEYGRQLYVFVEDYPSCNGQTLVRYNLPDNEVIAEAPAATFPEASGYMLNTDVNVVVNDFGVIISQVRSSGNNAKGVPSFLILDHDGNIRFNSGEELSSQLDGSTTGIALSDDGKRLAVSASGNAGEIQVYDVTWGEEIEMTLAYKFDIYSAGNCYQLQFDPAGNLLAGCRNGMRMYALPTDARTTITPAKKAMTIGGVQDGVEMIATDAVDNAPVVFYNLQGIRVDANNLTPGIYVKVQGRKATKVVVK